MFIIFQDIILSFLLKSNKIKNRFCLLCFGNNIVIVIFVVEEIFQGVQKQIPSHYKSPSLPVVYNILL